MAILGGRPLRPLQQAVRRLQGRAALSALAQAVQHASVYQMLRRQCLVAITLLGPGGLRLLARSEASRTSTDLTSDPICCMTCRLSTFSRSFIHVYLTR